MLSCESVQMKFQIIFVLIMSLKSGDTTRVVTFQPDGIASLNTQGIYNKTLNRKHTFSSVTICSRLQVFYLHGTDTFFNLRDDEGGYPHMIKTEIWVEKTRPALAARWNFMMLEEKLELHRWYHYCYTYDGANKMYKTYVDGKLIAELNYDIKRNVSGDFAVIGQGGTLTESFSGKLSQVNVWDFVVNQTVINQMAKCKVEVFGNYISWNGKWIFSEVQVTEASLSEFCNQMEHSAYFWFPDLQYKTSYYICEALGTHLPLPNTIMESREWLELAKQTWPTNTACHTILIIAANDIQNEGLWVSHFDSKIVFNTNDSSVQEIAWQDGEPNGKTYENCGKMEANGVSDISCLTRNQCAVCKFKRKHVYSLLGTCEDELRQINFLAYQKCIGTLYFRSYGHYIIEKLDNEWIWRDSFHNLTIAVMLEHEHNFPMGRRIWNLQTPLCKGRFKSTKTLLLTPCNDTQFSCDDATCIAHDQRCDLKCDCLDKSDEQNCHLVHIPAYYRKELPPRLNSKNTYQLPITVFLFIESISVDTTEMTLRTTFEFVQKWFDDRLTYRNLKINSDLNHIPIETMQDLWSPTIGFLNTDGNWHTLVDEETTYMVEKLVSPVEKNQSSPEEVELYTGEWNPLITTRKHSIVFKCDFNLVLYPSDEQYCDLYFGLLSASASYLKFFPEKSTVTYLGSTMMVEYLVQKPFILPTNSIDTSSNKTKICIRVPLYRRYGYAILTIYIPSLILLAISYVTLFFRTHIFEARVMAALTSLLVVATLFTQVSASLPKTSYFKMVDIWLLFCIAVIFLIIICHTLIDNALDKEESGSQNKIRGKYPRSQRSNKIGFAWTSYSENRRDVIILSSRLFVFILIALFNGIYWGIIML